MSCPRTQCSDAGEARTRNPSVSSQALSHFAHLIVEYDMQVVMKCRVL